MCGKLVYWLYGFRKAASEWEKFYAERLKWAGFKRGEGCPVVFHHSGRDVSGAVHGDDFVFTGLEADLRWMAQHMKKHFEIKVRAILGGRGQKMPRKRLLWGEQCDGLIGASK